MQSTKGELELARIYDSNNITKTKLSGLLTEPLNSFYINKEGNGFVFELVKEGIAIIKVKNFSIDLKEQIVYPESEIAKRFGRDIIFSYVQATNDKGYLICNDAIERKAPNEKGLYDYIIYYCKFSVTN